MRKKLLWVVLCLAVGVVLAPASYFALWSMRANFLGEYETLKADCERVWEKRITAQMEDDALETLATIESSQKTDYCTDLFTGLAAYRAAILNRSIGFGVVIFIGLLILRFVMFPFDDAPAWIEES